jgi:acid phosphatase class B
MVQDIFLEEYPDSKCCYIFSTIDFIKDIAYKCGWDGTKTGKNRKFLSDLKDLLTEWNDVPYQHILTQIEHIPLYLKEKDIIVFIDSREPEEIERFKRELDAKTLLIRRDENQIEITNHADRDVENYKYDYIIENNRSLIDLYARAREFLKEI